MAKYSQILQKSLIRLILCYRYLLSPIMGRQCRFDPSCSLYAIGAIQNFGCLKGMKMAIFRLLRCHPFCKGGYDPVPDRITVLQKQKNIKFNNKRD